MGYRPQTVLRVFIPIVGSKQRRLPGIPALEDKRVQAGIVKILQVIYEHDFIGAPYGFRSKRSCHDALRALSVVVES
jgi:retron-type reverse transcriptase